MDPIEVQLGESLGVLVEHSAELSPPKLLAFLEKTFGTTSYASTFILSNDNLATIVFFSEATNTTTCYLTLNQLTHGSEKPKGLEAVAWVSESAAAAFDKKPYVRSRWARSTVIDALSTSGYITIFWKRADATTRADLRAMATASTHLADSFVDEKEGGRLFLRFRSESEADDYRRHAAAKYAALSRDISYGSAEEFRLAATSAGHTSV